MGCLLSKPSLQGLGNSEKAGAEGLEEPAWMDDVKETRHPVDNRTDRLELIKTMGVCMRTKG